MNLIRRIADAIGAKFGTRRFEGARRDRTTTDWVLATLATNDDIRANLTTLVNRSRDLSKNNSDYRKWLSLRRKNVVGPDGFTMKAKVRNLPDRNGVVTQDRVANDILQTEWNAWGSRQGGAVSVDAQHSWLSFLWLVDRTYAVDGECFIRIIRGASNPWALSLQLLDSTQIDPAYNVADIGGGREIVMSVEIEKATGRPVAYHALVGASAYTPQGQTRVRIPAEDIIHHYAPEFVGQVRGFPMGCAAILDLNMANGYREASLVAARVAACQMGVWERPPNATTKLNFDTTDDGKPTLDMEPGKWVIAPRGWIHKAVTPTHPAAQFDGFIKSIDRKTSNGLDVAYNTFANDLEAVSYSSLRGGELDARDAWKIEQARLVESVVRRVWRVWLEQLLLTGRTILPFSKLAKFDAVVFDPRSWDWVDPLRDAKADREAIDMHTLAPQDVIRARGRDPDEVLEDIADWTRKVAAALGTAGQPVDAPPIGEDTDE